MVLNLVLSMSGELVQAACCSGPTLVQGRLSFRAYGTGAWRTGDGQSSY